MVFILIGIQQQRLENCPLYVWYRHVADNVLRCITKTL